MISFYSIKCRPALEWNLSVWFLSSLEFGFNGLNQLQFSIIPKIDLNSGPSSYCKHKALLNYQIKTKKKIMTFTVSLLFFLPKIQYLSMARSPELLFIWQAPGSCTLGSFLDSCAIYSKLRNWPTSEENPCVT